MSVNVSVPLSFGLLSLIRYLIPMQLPAAAATTTTTSLLILMLAVKLVEN